MKKKSFFFLKKPKIFGENYFFFAKGYYTRRTLMKIRKKIG